MACRGLHPRRPSHAPAYAALDSNGGTTRDRSRHERVRTRTAASHRRPDRLWSARRLAPCVGVRFATRRRAHNGATSSCASRTDCVGSAGTVFPTFPLLATLATQALSRRSIISFRARTAVRMGCTTCASFTVAAIIYAATRTASAEFHRFHDCSGPNRRDYRPACASIVRVKPGVVTAIGSAAIRR